jgi:hypothetical protein
MACCRKRRWRVRIVSGGVGFLRPWLGRPIGKQHQRTDHLVPPWHLIHEAQLQLRKRVVGSTVAPSTCDQIAELI